MPPKNPKTTSTAGNRKSAAIRFTYWLTRDTDPNTGVIDPKVRVWLAKPDRLKVGVGVVWMATDENLFAQWSLETCEHHARTYPDDDRQCICVGGDRVRDPEDMIQGKKPLA